MAISIIMFAVHNRELVNIHLAPFGIEVALPLYLLILSIFIVGVFVGGIANMGHGLKWRIRNNHASRKVKALENELASYRISQQLEEKAPLHRYNQDSSWSPKSKSVG